VLVSDASFNTKRSGGNKTNHLLFVLLFPLILFLKKRRCHYIEVILGEKKCNDFSFKLLQVFLMTTRSVKT